MSAPVISKRPDARETSQARALVNYVNRLTAMSMNVVTPQAALLGTPAQATNTTSVKLTNPVGYRVDGVLKQKAATDPLWTLTGPTLTTTTFLATSYLLLLDASGNPSVWQSDIIVSAAPNNNWFANWVPGTKLPFDGFAVIGWVQVVVSATTFIPGTTSLGAAGIAATYRDAFSNQSPFNTVLADLTGFVASAGSY